MGLKAKIKVNLDLPILRLQNELLEIANKVIIADLQGRMTAGRDISGRTYRTLAPSTIKQKQSKGLRTEPLLSTGQLRKSHKASKVGKKAVRITLAGTRRSFHGERSLTNKRLGDILQNDGVNSKFGKRTFEFFGISDKAEVKAIKMMQGFIRKAIKRGGRKTVR